MTVDTAQAAPIIKSAGSMRNWGQLTAQPDKAFGLCRGVAWLTSRLGIFDGRAFLDFQELSALFISGVRG
jgi:hypothetical protein